MLSVNWRRMRSYGSWNPVESKYWMRQSFQRYLTSPPVCWNMQYWVRQQVSFWLRHGSCYEVCWILPSAGNMRLKICLPFLFWEMYHRWNRRQKVKRSIKYYIMRALLQCGNLITVSVQSSCSPVKVRNVPYMPLPVQIPEREKHWPVSILLPLTLN